MGIPCYPLESLPQQYDIANSPDPETMPGAHLTDQGRATLAFVALGNFRQKAKDLLANRPFDIGAYIDEHTEDR